MLFVHLNRVGILSAAPRDGVGSPGVEGAVVGGGVRSAVASVDVWSGELPVGVVLVPGTGRESVGVLDVDRGTGGGSVVDVNIG